MRVYRRDVRERSLDAVARRFPVNERIVRLAVRSCTGHPARTGTGAASSTARLPGRATRRRLQQLPAGAGTRGVHRHDGSRAAAGRVGGENKKSP